jgi:subtilisin family serine protease
MNLHCLLFTFAATVAAATPLAFAASSKIGTNNPAGLQIVTLRPGVDVHGFLSEFGLKPGHIYRRALNGFAAPVTPEITKRLKQDRRIVAVESDGRVALSAHVVPTGIARMNITNFPVAHINGGDHRIAVDVAVIDSGIQTNHPDLNVVQAVTFTASGVVEDTLGHGTHVAGIVGALDNDIGVVGVAPGVRLWSVKTFDTGDSAWSTIIAGMDYVAANADKIAVVNASFATDGSPSPSDAIHQAVSNIVSQGVVFVAAAGNSTIDLSGSDLIFGTQDDVLPAGLPEVMAVSAMNPVNDTIANFSNFNYITRTNSFVLSPGAAIDLAAPGVDIYSTWVGSEYALDSGTSMAAPHVAGLVALYIAANGRAHSAQDVYRIRQAIVDNSLPQSQWHTNNAHDPDGHPEPLAFPSENWVPLPTIKGLTNTPEGFQLSLPAVPGYDYTLQYSDALLPPNQWSDFSTLTATGSVTALSGTDTNPNPAMRFYRAVRTPSP